MPCISLLGSMTPFFSLSTTLNFTTLCQEPPVPTHLGDLLGVEDPWGVDTSINCIRSWAPLFGSEASGKQSPFLSPSFRVCQTYNWIGNFLYSISSHLLLFVLFFYSGWFFFFWATSDDIQGLNLVLHSGITLWPIRDSENWTQINFIQGKCLPCCISL